ncbi:hypothetical protein SAMN05660909_05042 [Chitinophaga terrae (ex Kim and Jung 2007)]|uniref:Porin n=1 Tax=Chitinophaga terrae (ex Kim and Jung 2007) TaxID=408074 RepID=A0A1H4G8T2_9BACT|nr:hypothetical protein [Chitinophaga terrae (ex Kim and Jung 2007)]MDQ0109088.1 hypothetical protein [Chitinophaga terrae (ex Kim and Jung 2007)]GEP93209.1 hypothetical protein CTE07_48540 [Chitinophaga terrae (ex Kim and Jung 2007)]SEB05857.1 hypothetical protein SAMN05660909_05042 [Chitinophaga terrae (ex Kim and Jung 2007)]
MKSAILIITLSSLSFIAKAENDPPIKNKKKKGSYLIELPASLNTDSTTASVSLPDIDVPFKPSIQLGAIVHMFVSGEQSGFSAPSNDKSAKDWNKGFSLYRARVLVGGQLTKKASFFMETEIPSPIGIQSNGEKNVKVAPIILDAQLEYTFSNAFQLIAGMQLVSNNRNGLQGAAGLMANDFTYFQYPYNLFANSPLQGNFGRDLGINARGFLANDKLEYRLGVFTGRNIDGGAPLRTVGRLAYNFLDAEKDFYYAGTKLGKGKTLAWAVGFDEQANYVNYSTDVFFDHPLGNAGSITANAAFQYMSGGTDLSSKYSFATLIPKQTVQYLELGYYFKGPKLQPWIRYENQAIKSEPEQAGSIKPSSFDKVNSSSVMGGGLNYFFNGTGTNLRLSYTTRTYNVATAPDDYTKKTFGQLWLQAQFFIF